MFSIQLLGPPLITRDGAPVSIARRKSRALLCYLAAQPGPSTRDQLLALLWPDLERTEARQVLRSTIYSVRQALGAALLTTDDTLAIAPSVQVDARRFTAQLDAPAGSAAELAEALALYRGEFLAGFSLPDAEEFERWLAAARERYRTLALRGYAALAQRYEAQQQYAAALDALAQALALNPLHEDLQRAAMRAAYYSGDRAGAIRRYEQLRQLLDDELGVPPLDETRALYDAIITDTLELDTEARRHGDPGHSTSSVSWSPHLPASLTGTLPFTGRAAELASMRSATAAGQLVLIEGEPGIGKTRLAEAFIDSFSGLAISGAAHELERALPYQPLIDALRGLLRRPALDAALGLAPVWRGELARLLPELHAPSAPIAIDPILPGGGEARLWEAVNQLLLALAHRQPVVLLLDDLHWSDSATLALLGYLIRQSSVAPISFLATARAAAPRSQLAALLQTLTREGRLARLPLARLAPTDTIELARHLSPTFAYPLADWLDRNADGNPYILAELVRYAHEHGILRADGVLNLAALSADPVVPRSVYSLIQSRLDALSEPARRVLDVAVAIGREFDAAVVAPASGMPEASVLDALDELRAIRLIRPLEGLRYSFDHPLTLEVAYREVGEARHRAIHRSVAEALAQIYQADPGDAAGLIASHFAEGNATERAATYAFLAGRRAAALAAWTEAVAFFRQALAGAEPTQRAEIALALGNAYLRSGSSAQAAEVFQQALALAEAHGQPALADQAHLNLGRALINQARYAEGVAIAQQILAGPRAEGNRIEAELLWGTVLSIEGVDLAGAAQHLEAAARACTPQGDPEHLAHITFEMGSIAAQQGDLETAVERYREALALAERAPVLSIYRVLALNNLGYHLLLLGDPSARAHAEAGLELARAHGLLSFQAFLHSTLGEIALAAGDLAAAEHAFTAGLDLAERLSIRERIAGLTANLGRVAAQHGQAALAIHRLSTAQAHADSLGTHHLAAQIRIWLAPLLPAAERRAMLAEARAIAIDGGRRRLLAEIDELLGRDE